MELTIRNKSLFQLLRENHCMYTNNLGVTFYLDKSGQVYITCDYPGFDAQDSFNSLALFKNYPDTEAFETCGDFKLIGDIENISPLCLLSFYKKGIINVSCYIENNGIGYHFIFQKKGDIVTIREIDKGEEFEILNCLKKANDFIDYSIYHLITGHRISKVL